MRAGIRKALIDNIKELKGCYEPNIPNKDTKKPYMVVVQGQDNDHGETIGFERSIEVWIYEGRTTFKKLDKLTKQVVEVLDMNTIVDESENEAFTCIYKGTSENDIVVEEWDAIARGIRFSVIALEDKEDTTNDRWVEALSRHTKDLLEIESYKDNWKKNFIAPCALWRTTHIENKRINYHLIEITKTMKCHVVSKNKDEIVKLLETLETSLIIDKRVRLREDKNMYLTLVSVVEDRESDMFTTGQLTAVFKMIGKIKREGPTMDKIYGNGNLK
ncbi:TPA: hypothetical protein ACSRFI_003702 [Clostridioides difficile]|nr:hypothetical protein [Clostridioides difficile]